MIGLPGETEEDIVETIDLMNQVKIHGVKIHSTYVVDNTKLHTMYQTGKYTPITIEYYIQQVIFILTHLDSSIIIHRITGDAPKSSIVAPTWTTHKKRVLNAVEKIMKENNFSQGMYTK